MEKGILKIQSHTHEGLLETFPDNLNVFHTEVYVEYVIVELSKVQDRSPPPDILIDSNTAKYELRYCPYT